MSAVIGERDKVLRATVPRNLNPSLGKSLSVDVDPPAFHQNSAGIPTIPSATFTATPDGFVGQVLWSITSGGKLTGTTPNERTLLFSDMTSDTVKVTATIVYYGQAYIAVKTFYKLTDGAPGKDGKDANPEDLSPAALAAILEGQITESQLAHDLASRIDLVDGPASNPTSVQGRVKAETDARVAAIAQEAADRVTYVQQYTYSEQEIDNSLSVFATTITSQYKAYADGVSGAAVSQSTAYVQNYAYSKSATDNALSAMANTLRSEFATNNGVTTGYLNQYYYTQAQTNSAISSATTTLSTTVNQHTTTLQTQAQSIDGLSAQYTVKIDNNGRVSGFGLASTPVNGAAYSIFAISADAFSVGAPGVPNKQMFTVGQVNGQVAMVLRGDALLDGAVVARHLTVGLGGLNMVVNSGPSSTSIANYVAGFNATGRTLTLIVGGANGGTFAPTGGGSVGLFALGYTPPSPADNFWFDLNNINSPTSGAYAVIAGQRYEASAYLSTHRTTGAIAIRWYNESGAIVGENFGNGIAAYAATGPLSGWPRSVVMATAPANAAFGLVFVRATPNGQAEPGVYASMWYFGQAGINQTEPSAWSAAGVTVIDGDMITTKSIRAEKILVDSLQAISNIVTARVGGSGAGIDQDQNGIRIYAPNGMRVVQLGNLDV